MRALTVVLTVVLGLIQVPLWFGDGGWIHAWELDRKLQKQLQINAALTSRNDAVEAEVKDLLDGRSAVEERARYDLGMIGKDEVFVQINEPMSSAPPEPPASTRTASLN
ncbi:MAG: cell division protein FtsB [Burkholderiaceae bacterium]